MNAFSDEYIDLGPIFGIGYGPGDMVDIQIRDSQIHYGEELQGIIYYIRESYLILYDIPPNLGGSRRIDIENIRSITRIDP